MLLIEVNNKHYKFYNEWRDVTIKQMMRWAQTDIPKCLVEAIDAMGDMVEVDGEKKAAGITGYFKHIEKLTPDERRKEIPRYIGVMLEAFTDIPPDVIAKINDADRTSFFHDYLIVKLLDVRLMTKLQLQDIAKFEFNGKTYHLPKIGKAINADSKGIDLMAVEFAESSDIAANADKLQGGNLEALPYLLALLCKEDGEQYDEQNVMKSECKECMMCVCHNRNTCNKDTFENANVQDFKATGSKIELLKDIMKEEVEVEGRVNHSQFTIDNGEKNVDDSK